MILLDGEHIRQSSDSEIALAALQAVETTVVRTLTLISFRCSRWVGRGKGVCRDLDLRVGLSSGLSS